jgi:ribonucleotide reductase alpha subunit
MFNAGTTSQQMASCFLLQLPGDQDSIDAIFSGLKNCAAISKTAGGIGLAVHNVRATGSYIAGTNGTSNGLVPMLRVYNSAARYVDQGGNKRPGAFACYLEPWHADIEAFLRLKLPTGVEETRARDLFYALWVPDLFMRRVRDDEQWSLFCPHECPGLAGTHGPEFDTLFLEYEKQGLARKQLPARELWLQVLRSQKESGTPYILFKDHCNYKSNQRHLGTIQSSNLCVAGGTRVLTAEGPLQIRALAEAYNPTEEGPAGQTVRVALKGALDQLEAAGLEVEPHREQLAAVTIPDLPHETVFAIEKAAGALTEDEAPEARLARVAKTIVGVPPTQPKREDPIDVWNGQNWSKVVPKRTADLAGVMRITTSHGAQLDCTPEHVFVLASGDRIPARELALGTALAPTPPVVYPGIAEGNLYDTNITGFVYGYALVMLGSDPRCTTGAPPTMRVPKVPIARSEVTPEALKGLGYDRAAAEAALPEVDHDRIAAVQIPEPLQKVRPPPLDGNTEVRRAWVAGFLTAVGPRLDGAFGPRPMTQPAWQMLRGVGEAAQLSPDPEGTGLWRLKWIEDDQPPVITGIQQLGTVCPTYCFTEPEANAGVFGGQLTGQCAEIVEYSAADEIAVCNLSSVVLNRFVDDNAAAFDFKELHRVVKLLVINMNKIVDRNHYVLPGMAKSNLRHRPIGIGVQGLADTFAMLQIPWEKEYGTAHPAAKLLNKQIFETMYHAALEASCELAASEGPYSTYAGSPASQGQLQFDLWGVTPTDLWDWESLRAAIAKDGLRNSLLLACMPTATTAQILGNNEGFEPFHNTVYKRKVLSGEFQVVNRHLVKALTEVGLWSAELRERIIASEGSIQHMDQVPAGIRAVYKTVWEISQKTLIDLAADRGAFICQSQSFSLFMAAPTDQQLTSALMYAWQKGLKTGLYYLRSKPAVAPQPVTVDPALVAACSRENPGDCVMCGS